MLQGTSLVRQGHGQGEADRSLCVEPTLPHLESLAERERGERISLVRLAGPPTRRGANTNTRRKARLQVLTAWPQPSRLCVDTNSDMTKVVALILFSAASHRNSANVSGWRCTFQTSHPHPRSADEDEQRGPVPTGT
jgi:hypothetical protein